MERIHERIKERIAQLISEGKADRFIGWKKGEFVHDQTPATFTDANDSDFVYDSFSSPNLSKYLIAESKKDGKIIALLKPCDTYSFNQLLKEHRINRDNVHIIGIPCAGKIDAHKIRERGIDGVLSVEEAGKDVIVKTLYGNVTVPRGEIMLERCLSCRGSKHMIADEVIERESESTFVPQDRFAQVNELDAMTADEKFAFWQGQLSKCIRCNSCRNVCPACSCFKCVFDNPASGVASKVSSDKSEDSLFHIIRAFHVAGRCTDCGECSRVCPQSIPLHLLNRKFIHDINTLYGEYQAGEDISLECPLTDFKENDSEPRGTGGTK
jgi:Uncharacterized conserved protein containing a ferredoxin-like domain